MACILVKDGDLWSAYPESVVEESLSSAIISQETLQVQTLGHVTSLGQFLEGVELYSIEPLNSKLNC